MELLTEKPVLLVEHCARGEFKPHRDGLEVLRRIRATGIKVVCVAGPFRLGKSYLANKLMGQQSGFGIGHTTQGKTRGVWMWAKDGGVDGEALVVLDTEGLDDPGHEDSGPKLNAKLFTLAVLLSSELLLNTQHHIDGQAIEQLGFVTQLAEQIHLNGSTDFYPTLRWVVRDFELQLDGQTFDDYLAESLSPVKGLSESAQSQNKIRAVIREKFSGIKGAPITYPVFTDDHEEAMGDADPAWEAKHLQKQFQEDIAGLVTATVTEAPIKKLGVASMSGGSIASWVETVTTAVNKNLVNMPDAIQCLIKTETCSVVAKATAAYDSSVDAVVLPVDQEKYEAAHKEGLIAATGICAGHSMTAVHEAAKEQVESNVKGKKEVADRQNLEQSRLHCEDLLMPLERKLKARLDQHAFKDLKAYTDAKAELLAEFDKGKVGPAASAVMREFEQRREGDIWLVGVQNKLEQTELELANSKAMLEQQRKEAADAEEEAAKREQRIEDDMRRLRQDNEALEKRMADDRAAFERERSNSGSSDGILLLIMLLLGQQQQGGWF